jgi:hypothetical protein
LNDEIADVYDYFKGLSAELLIYTPEEFKLMEARPFIRRAVREGIVAYEHGEE